MRFNSIALHLIITVLSTTIPLWGMSRLFRISKTMSQTFQKFPRIACARLALFTSLSGSAAMGAITAFQLRHDAKKMKTPGQKNQMPVVFAHGLGGNRIQAAAYSYSEYNSTGIRGPDHQFRFL